MRTTDERMDEVLRRASAREAAGRRRRQRAVAIGGGALSIAIVAVVGAGLASIARQYSATSPGATVGLMGSVLAGGSALGYVVAGLVGLVIGVTVTVLAFRVGRRSPAGELREAQITATPDDEGTDNEGRMP